MCRGDDTNNFNILIDLCFRTENQVQLPFMSPVPVVSALGYMKSSGCGDDIGLTRQWLDFWNSSFETYSFSVLFLSLSFRENFLNPRRPQKKKKSDSRILLQSATHQCLVCYTAVFSVVTQRASPQRDVQTSRTLHSQLPPLLLGFLSPISPVVSKHLKSKVPF